MPPRALLATLFATLVGFLPALCERSSSERALSLDAADLLRDAPLYPPLQDTLYPNTRSADPQINEATRNTEDDTFPQTNTLYESTRNADETLYPNTKNTEDDTFPQTNTLYEAIRNVEVDDTFPQNDDTVIQVTRNVYDPQKATRDAEDKDGMVEKNPNDLTDTESLDNNPNLIALVENPDNLDPDSLQNQPDQIEPIDKKFQPFFDTEDESIEIETDPETSIEDSGIVVTPDETSLPDDKTNEIPINENYIATERLDDKDILDKGDRVEDLPNARIENENRDLQSNRKGETLEDIEDARIEMQQNDSIEDLLSKVEVEEKEEYNGDMNISEDVLREILGGDEEDSDRTKRSAGQDWDKTKQQKRERELLVEPHAAARLPCDVANISNVRWYRDNEQMNLPTSPGADGVYRDGATLVVGRATRHHAGRWRCTGRDGSGRAVSGEPTRLMIYEPVRSVYLAVDGRRLDAGNTWVPVRDRAELVVRCVAEGGVPSPELSWRLMALEPTLDHKPYLRPNPTNYSVEGVSFSRVSLTAARELHNATLLCTARQRSAAAPRDSTAKLQIHVTYPPSFVISRWPGFGVALWAGGAAALRCDVDANPPARATWTRHDRAPVSLAPVEEGGAGEAATLRWGALRAAHAGWYRCRARWADTDYYSIGYYLNVLASEEAPTTEAEPEPEPETQKVEVPLGGNVQLHCPKGSVGCWWRRVVGNASDSWAPAGSHHAHGVLGIKEAVYEEGGEYRCVGARAPDLQRLRELKRVTLAVTGGATATAISSEAISGGWRLTCGACGRNLRVVWVRGGRAAPAALVPDLAQHCWRAQIALPEPDEVWCVVSASNGGAVAVFPRRPPPSPAPARHAVRALHAGCDVTRPLAALLAAAVMVWI
ncbi:uncharacterized protein LOC121737980 isoform X2 [Aricia agestis]|uniref:uncharacterized protein LOC121737980 isoform X2 n=1 Tax=Aricia agestis TaxID=91739 RepID=UPI001C20B145|nr:uncharacterized protein LOC121737980 isoform X2 [Aricia agestis]